MALVLGAVAALACAAAIDAVATRAARAAGLRRHGARRWLTVTAGAHAAILLGAWAEETRLKAALAVFDIDGNGWLAGAELTPAQQAAASPFSAASDREAAAFFVGEYLAMTDRTGVLRWIDAVGLASLGDFLVWEAGSNACYGPLEARRAALAAVHGAAHPVLAEARARSRCGGRIPAITATGFS